MLFSWMWYELTLLQESLLSEKTYSSSKEFFRALQNEVKLDKKLSNTKAALKKKKSTSKSADKLKLWKL